MYFSHADTHISVSISIVLHLFVLFFFLKGQYFHWSDLIDLGTHFTIQSIHYTGLSLLCFRGEAKLSYYQVLLCCFKCDSIVLAFNPEQLSVAVMQAYASTGLNQIPVLYFDFVDQHERGVYREYAIDTFLRRKCLSYNGNHFSKHINSAQ